MVPFLRQHLTDLYPLLALLRPGSVVAELGAFAGDSTRQFLASDKVARLYSVDWWMGGYDADDQASSANMVEAEAAFDLLLGDSRLVKVRDDTVRAALTVPDGLDMVYLDADHRYHFVVQDLAAWVPKVKAGGFIAGHDYTDGTHEGVRRAVDARFHGIEHIVILPDSSWVVRLPGGKDRR